MTLMCFFQLEELSEIITIIKPSDISDKEHYYVRIEVYTKGIPMLNLGALNKID